MAEQHRGQTDKRIAVGVHDSPSSWTALRLAAREAAVQGRQLRLVHALNWVPDDVTPITHEAAPDATELIRRAIDMATVTTPGIDIAAEVSESAPATALLRESRMASLVVVGDGDLARWTCLPLDALAVQIAARADCSTLVVRATPDQQPPPPQGTVVVGVDGSAGSERALGFAFETAAHRNAPLVVVQAWENDLGWADTASTAAAELAQAVAPWQEKHPEVRAAQHVVNGEPARVLIDRSATAALVVVGARGDHPLRVPLGAVSQAVLHHAQCPTAIVRDFPPMPSPGD